MRLLPLLLVLPIVFSWACRPKSSPPDKATEACATDNDCVLTARRLNHCCSDCTLPYAVARSRAAAIERWHRSHCQRGTYACPKVDCKHPGTERAGTTLAAKCKRRRCVTEVTLAQPPTKPMR